MGIVVYSSVTCDWCKLSTVAMRHLECESVKQRLTDQGWLIVGESVACPECTVNVAETRLPPGIYEAKVNSWSEKEGYRFKNIKPLDFPPGLHPLEVHEHFFRRLKPKVCVEEWVKDYVDPHLGDEVLRANVDYDKSEPTSDGELVTRCCRATYFYERDRLVCNKCRMGTKVILKRKG